MKVRFSNFWPGFDTNNNLFLSVLRERLHLDIEIVQSPRRHVDLEITSVFTGRQLVRRSINNLRMQFGLMQPHDYQIRHIYRMEPRKTFNAKRVLWFSGENIHPISQHFDGTLSFTATDPKRRNLYFPYWLYRLDWQFKDSPNWDISIKPSELTQSRKLKMGERSWKAFILSSHRSPLRETFVDYVQDVLSVDRYGSAYGRVIKSKKQISEAYLFQICPENSIFPGYVTEKLVEAWACGNVALWQGLHLVDTFNKGAYIDFTTASRAEIFERLHNLTREELEHMVNQPLLKDEPTLDELEQFLLRILDS